MRLSGRFVRVFQWIAPVLLPLMVLFGRGVLGAPMGWMTLIGIFAAPFVIIAMYIPPIIVAFDRDAKAGRSTRRGYNIASWVVWGGLLGIMFTLADGGDSPPFGSVLSTWGLNTAVTGALFGAAMFAVVIGWIAALVYAIAGVVVSRAEGRVATGTQTVVPPLSGR
ncbi:hypothetical protein [Microbacterium sp. A93]|uniref:hypothetical protein n=1 Tax=Microbacterium sp. A93 TaxID=3450716 RepID=UPI003F4293DA